MSLANWLYAIISLLSGAGCFLLVAQKDIPLESKVLGIFINATIGIVLTILSKRTYSEQSAINQALADSLSTLFKETDDEPFDAAKSAERLGNELKLTKERDRLTFEYGDRFVFKLDADGKFLGLNRFPECFMGYGRSALLGASLTTLVAPGSVPTIQKALATCRETQQPCNVEIEMRTLEDAIDLDCTMEWSQRTSAFYCVGQDITERKKIERYRAEVTAMLGHDLRGPLASLSLLLENAFRGVYGEIPANLKDALDRAKQSSRAMVSLINRLLEADKLEAGQPTVKEELFYCEDLIEEAVQVFRDLSESKQIAIDCRVDSSDAFADYSHSFQIVSNLIGNAIKFSPPDSVITIRCYTDGSKSLIEVSDQGPGVPAELTDTLFDRYKSKATGSEPVASSGLGLFIARKLARLQGGDIGFKPNTDGPGTTFWLSLPKRTG